MIILSLNDLFGCSNGRYRMQYKVVEQCFWHCAEVYEVREYGRGHIGIYINGFRQWQSKNFPLKTQYANHADHSHYDLLASSVLWMPKYQREPCFVCRWKEYMKKGLSCLRINVSPQKTFESSQSSLRVIDRHCLPRNHQQYSKPY